MGESIFIKTQSDLDEYKLRNFYNINTLITNDGYPTDILIQSLDKILVGKPIIAGFLGVSEKTLKRYFKEDHKLNSIPIVREQYRCLSVTNYLLIWIIDRELEKIDNKLVEKARCVVTAQHLRVSLEHFMEHYIYSSQCREEPNTNRLRTKRYYRKTVDATVGLVRLRSIIAMRTES
ncbi:MAG TPA: hypothetical protein DCS09_08400 [Porphyromonadaceae bacterium]|nr:hypothetical protein [Porphyromonadaceae bacterium]